MTGYNLDQFGDDAASAVDQFISETLAAKGKFQAAISECIDKAQSSGIDAHVAAAILQAHMKQIEAMK